MLSKKNLRLFLLIAAILAVVYVYIFYKIQVKKINMEVERILKEKTPNHIEKSLHIDPEVLKLGTAPRSGVAPKPLDPAIIKSLTMPVK